MGSFNVDHTTAFHTLPPAGRIDERPMGEEGNANSLQYSCLANPMDRGAWWATVHGVTVGHDLMTEQEREPLHCVGLTKLPLII